MNEVLLQKKFGIGKKEFRLTENALAIRERKNQKEWEYSVPYEKIGFDTVIKKDLSTARGFWISVTLFVIGLVGMALLLIYPPQAKDRAMYGTMPLLTALVGLLTIKAWRQRNLVYEYLTGGEKNIEFFKSTPDEASYEAFKAALYERIKTVHKKRLLYDVDLNMPFETFADRIKWLKRMNAISDEEIQDFRRRLRQHQYRHLN
jgi:hypothetical protein